MLDLATPLGDRALLAVANTRHGSEAWRPIAPPEQVGVPGGFDRLLSPREVVRFLAALEVPVPSGVPDREQVLRLRDVREAVRALAEGGTDRYERRVRRLAQHSRFRLHGRELLAEGEGWDRFIGDLVIPLRVLAGDSTRLRLCHNNECTWVFIDHTRNANQVWCDAQLCGERERMRRFRERRSTRPR